MLENVFTKYIHKIGILQHISKPKKSYPCPYNQNGFYKYLNENTQHRTKVLSTDQVTKELWRLKI